MERKSSSQDELRRRMSYEKRRQILPYHVRNIHKRSESGNREQKTISSRLKSFFQNFEKSFWRNVNKMRLGESLYARDLRRTVMI